MSALTASRAFVGHGTQVHALLPGQLSYGRESVCGYWYPIENLRVTDSEVSCKRCAAAPVGGPAPESETA